MSYRPKVLNPLSGGTGVANADARTITLGGALTTSGAFDSTFTMTDTTAVTFPTTGTLATIAQAGSKVLISSQTVSGSSAIVFTSGITGFTQYYLEGYNITATSSGGTGYLTFSTDGGSTYSSTNYRSNGLDTRIGAVDPLAGPTDKFQLFGGQSTSSTLYSVFQCYLYNLNSSSLGKCVTWTAQSDWNGGGDLTLNLAGYWTTTTAVNALKIEPSAGTFDGTFRLFGVN